MDAVSERKAVTPNARLREFMGQPLVTSLCSLTFLPRTIAAVALAPGTRIGPYEVASLIGEGGMGEVYRARDVNLGRQIAIKVLPEPFAQDNARLARFEREAKTLAALNHPNIAIVHGFERTDGTGTGGQTPACALIMELVEGPTLEDRIGQGPIPLDEALTIARGIAEALEAAHEQGIVHRDLKPANVKVRPDGTVKVLDFGLAKTMEPAGALSPGQSRSPTVTSPAMTQAGMILGTAAYMSPEQAKGRSADKRSDLWAFGCLFYEMLTAKRAFEGDDVSETLASILRSDPDWRALPADTPTSIRRLLRRCLEKDRKRRLADAGDARLEVEDARSIEHQAIPSSGSDQRWRPWLIGAAIALLGAAAGGGALWIATRPGPARVTRLAIPRNPAALGTGTIVAITPDGARVVYRDSGALLVRALDALEPVVLAKGGAGSPFISPDGQWVGFWDGGALKKIAITGGPALTIARGIGQPGVATWGPDNTIVFSANAPTGLRRVHADGGEVTVLTTPDTAAGQFDHDFPQFLPDGKAVLFTIRPLSAALAATQIAVLDLETGTPKVLLHGGTHARYLSTGHLIYGSDGALRAVRFDARRRIVSGTPVPVLTQVAITAGGVAHADVASDGTLVYLEGTGVTDQQRTLAWLDRDGNEQPLQAAPRAYQYPRVSPEGSRVLVFGGDQDLFVYDLARATLTRVTHDPSSENLGLWMPDTKRILFNSNRGGAQNLYLQAADGTGQTTRLTQSSGQQFPTGVTPDGSAVVFYETTANEQRNIGLLKILPTPQTTWLVDTPFDERGGVVSPDGRWLAYEANNNADRYEVFVRPFPNVNDGVWQISVAGGAQPLWEPHGRELFYATLDGALMSAAVQAKGAVWSHATPTTVLDGNYVLGPGLSTRQYDITPDGKRFILVKQPAAGADRAPSVIVVQHWLEELKRLAPIK
jgi:serine/threonine-protein kinase